MKKISRIQAERLMIKHKVIKTKVTNDKRELSVIFTLSNSVSFLIKYDVKKRDKTYYLKN
jgi:hypothetical protein